MSKPVNLLNLRELTGDNVELEKSLFEAFLRSSAECISDLERHTDPDHAEIWRRKAHAMKGICFNLGAKKLGELCKKTQDGFMASALEKQKMLAELAKEYQRVKTFLETQ